MRLQGAALLIATNTLSAAPPEKVYLSTDRFASVIEVDISTGDRRFIDLPDFPRIIKATDVLVEPDGTFLIDTFDALQRPGIYRHDPRTGVSTPISGGVDGFSTDLLGDGPPLTPTVNTLLCESAGTIIAIRPNEGPMRIDLETGKRTLLSQSSDPPLGIGPPISFPVDAVLPAPDRLWLLLAFEGIIEVRMSTGDRRMAFPNSLFTVVPARFDLLRPTRLVYTANLAGEGTVFQYDTATGQDSIFSGDFGGLSRGQGEPIQTAGDVIVSSDGMVWVYDPEGARLFRIDPETGDRSVIASTEQNLDVPLWTFDDRPTIAILGPPPPANASSWLIY